MMIYLIDYVSSLLSVITSEQKEQDQGSTEETAGAVCYCLSSPLKTMSKNDDQPNRVEKQSAIVCHHV
jgi:hypothetical protein